MSYDSPVCLACGADDGDADLYDDRELVRPRRLSEAAS